MTTYYPARGSAERIIGQAQGAAGHVHPGYSQHFLGDIQPPNPRGGDMWTRGGSVEFSFTDLTLNAVEVDDFFIYETPGGILSMRFVLPDGASDVQALTIKLSYAVADATYASGTPRLDLILNSGETLQVPLDGATEDLVMVTADVAAPASWLALAENESFLDVDYAVLPDEIAIYDLSFELLRTGFVYSYDGAQWVLMSTGGQVIESHNQLIGREAINAHPIAAVTDLQTTLDGKAQTAHLHNHGSLGDLNLDQHPQYLDSTRGYTRNAAGQVFVNIIGDTMTGPLVVNAQASVNDLVVRSPDASHPAIEFQDSAGSRLAEISAFTDKVQLRAVDGSVMAESTVGRTNVYGMLNIQPSGVSNEASITAGEGPPDNAVIVDGFGLYIDITGQAGGPIYYTEIPGDNTTWASLGTGLHNHDGDYVKLADHGSSDHSGLVATLAPKTHLPTAQGGTSAGDLLHVQYPSIQPSDLALSSAIGVSDTIARADHVHKRPSLAELNAAAAAHTHAATEIDTGTIAFARLPTGTTSSTVAIGNHTHFYVPVARVLNAGLGLTGGGTLSGDRTFNVGAGTGISVAADSISINRATVDPWYDAQGTGASEASSAISTHVGLADPHTQYQLESQKGAASGYAPLGADSIVPSAYLPAVAPTTYFNVADATARKTLSSYSPDGLYRGDNVIQASPAETYVYIGSTEPADQTAINADANWQQLASGGVQSVNSLTGVVTLDYSDVGAPPNARTITAGSGLTGGGDLSANRTINVGAGTGISVAADTISVNRAVVDGWYAAPGDITTAIGTHSTSDDHDGRYYTETEIDASLAGKSDTGHLHDTDYVNIDGDTMTGELRITADFSASGMVRTGSDPANFATKPGAIWIREDDDTGAAEPIFDPANYAAVGHLHAGVYSPIGHSHSGDWALSAHTHSQYADDLHIHADYLSASGGVVSGDLDVVGMVSSTGFVRTTDPPVLKTGQFWVDEDDPGTALGDPTSHTHTPAELEITPLTVAFRGDFVTPSDDRGVHRVNTINQATVHVNTLDATLGSETISVPISGYYMINLGTSFGSSSGSTRVISMGTLDGTIADKMVVSAHPQDANTSGFGFGTYGANVIHLDSTKFYTLTTRQDSGANNTAGYRFAAVLLHPDEDEAGALATYMAPRALNVADPNPTYYAHILRETDLSGNFGTPVTITGWDSEETPTSDYITPMNWSSDGVIIPADGVYSFTGRIQLDANPAYETARIALEVTINGSRSGDGYNLSQIHRGHESNSIFHVHSMPYFFNAGDVVSMSLAIYAGPATANMNRADLRIVGANAGPVGTPRDEQWGRHTLAVPDLIAGGGYFETVTFPEPFLTIPNISLEQAGLSSGSQWYRLVPYSITATNFRIYVYNLYNTTTTAKSLPVDWHAVEKRPAGMLVPTGDTDWTAPSLINGFTNYSASWEQAGFRRDDAGTVHLRGLLNPPSISGSTATPAFVLPVGYRPAQGTHHLVYALSGPYVCQVMPDGNVQFRRYSSGDGSENTTYVSLSGVTFVADQ